MRGAYFDISTSTKKCLHAIKIVQNNLANIAFTRIFAAKIYSSSSGRLCPHAWYSIYIL
jgi:hypothetical protein